jgi:formamidopyrimidine-DNA glycosylase
MMGGVDVPELPEVEMVRRTLAPAIGRRIRDIWTSGKPLRGNRPVPAARLSRYLCGRRILGVRRLGKYLLIDVDPGPEDAAWAILIHLGMSGRLRLMAATEPRALHTHVVFSLDRGIAELRFSDPRRFGQVDVVRRGDERVHPSLSGLGRDPLEENVDGEWLYARMRGCARSIKALLLDQYPVAGVGNIYASEALWEARIRPTVRARTVSRDRSAALAMAIRRVLLRALDHGGTSLRDFVDAAGREGENAEYLVVYDRAGFPCIRRECGQPIRRVVIQGRATFYCPRCQTR